MSSFNVQLRSNQFHFPGPKGDIDNNVIWSKDIPSGADSVDTRRNSHGTQHLFQQNNSLPATHNNVWDSKGFVVDFPFTESTTLPMEEYFSGPSIDRSSDPSQQEPKLCENIRKKLCRLHTFSGIQCSLIPSHLLEPCSKCTTSGKPTEEFNDIFPSTQNHDSDDSIFVFEM
jgi:hypothetical protein